MAVVLGTNAGFVTEAPVADPEGSKRTIDNNREATKDTSSATAGKITEVGWYCPDATEESNFQIGLYAHDAGDDKPAARLYVDDTNAKGTEAGWKTVAVNWSIDTETIYWLAITVVDTATTTYIDYVASGRFSTYSGHTLPNPWGTSNEGTVTHAIYAVWEEVSYVDLAGTGGGIGAGTGILAISEYTSLAGTGGGLGSGSAILFISGLPLSKAGMTYTYKRVVAIGNNKVFYEDV